MSSLVVPDTGLKIVDGTIVMLARFPGTKWIVHNGWYCYQGNSYMGWYFCSIPAQTIIPVNDEDLRLLTVISSDGGESCPPGGGNCGCPPTPYPPITPPGPPGLHPGQAWELDRAWISVETIAQRDRLNTRLLPNGKIVRVNNVSGVAKYYIWNQVTQKWEDEHFGINTSDFVSSDEVTSIVDSAVSNLDLSVQIEQTIENSESVHNTINNIIDQLVPDIVEDSTKELSDQITILNEQVTNINDTIDDIPEWNQLS